MPLNQESFERNRIECLEIVGTLGAEIKERGASAAVRSTGLYAYIEIYTPHNFTQEDVKSLMDEMYDRIPDKFITHNSLPKPGTSLPTTTNNR